MVESCGRFFVDFDTATSPVVEYDYADGSTNTIRRTSMTYPDGRQLIYNYGVDGSQTDQLDRVAALESRMDFQSVPETIVTYQYTGSGTVVTQTYSQPNVEQTLALGSGSDPYSALDRFGRMVDLRWTKSSIDLVRFDYGYDQVSNRLFERNRVVKTNLPKGANPNPGVDSLFEFDSLNRMIGFHTGQLNIAGDSIASPLQTQTFELDETGNISRHALASGSVTTLDQTRSHNGVNEITNITETVGAAWATPAHDDAGNMTSIPKNVGQTVPGSQSFAATWDAWSRLVKLQDGSDTVAVYQYDGNNRRIVKQSYSLGTLDETRHVYYSSQSQAIEERVGTSNDARQQFVWNLGYIDDLVLRDCDTNNDGALNERLYALHDLRFCVMALANTSGTIVERYQYDAHGRASVLTAQFDARNSSSYDWQFRYTGRREDLETGLYYFRARYYHAQLGRFISRDPLGFVDGMSLYRAFFVPGNVDPSGLVCRAPDVCGPDATGAFAQFLALIAPKLRQTYRDEVSVHWDRSVRSGIAVDWLAENGNSIDFWLGKANFIKTQFPPCGTGNCEGTVELCGMCVRSTVPNNILYGIVAKMRGAYDWIIIAGGQVNNWQKGQGMEGAEQRQAYRCGIKLWALLSDKTKYHSKDAVCNIIKDCAGTSFDSFKDCESCGQSAPLKDFKRGIGNGIALPNPEE